MDIPIKQIKKHMAAYPDKPLPFEYAEILIGSLDEAMKLLENIKAWDIQQAAEKGTYKLVLPTRLRKRTQKLLSF